MRPSVDLDIRPVTPDQHDAVLRYFDLVAYADNPAWSTCYCMERLAPDYPERTKDQNRASRSELIRSARANGLVAYRLGRVVGWCHAAPKNELLSVPPGSDDETVGAIVCFVVAPDARRQGIATALLGAAVEHLRDRGMTAAEAYPRTTDDDGATAQALYVGPKAMYLRAGFEAVRDTSDFTVVRKAL
jgi:ribosomal protein S18 acetylase RimI-like enzyme